MKNYLLNQLLTGLILLIIITPAFALANDKQKSADIAEIKSLGKQWVELYKSSNIEKFMDQYTQNALVALNSKPAMHGKEAIKAYFETRIGDEDVDMRLEYEKISYNQNMAVVVAKFYLDIPVNEQKRTISGRSLIVYRKSASGQWLIEVDIDQNTPDTD
ncbi:MAG: YybH family protein [Candidatus Micropelagos sp.]